MFAQRRCSARADRHSLEYAITILESEWCGLSDSHPQVNDFSYVHFMEMKNYAFSTIIINNKRGAAHIRRRK